MDFAITSFGFVCDNILCVLPGAASRGLVGAKVIFDAMGSVPMSIQLTRRSRQMMLSGVITLG